MHNFRPLSILPGGYLIQKTLRGCAANMGSKISLLVYEWHLIKCKIWYVNGSIFQKFPKFGKIGWFCSKFGQKFGPIGIWMGHFFLKTWYLYGLLSNSVAAHPYRNQTWVPPGYFNFVSGYDLGVAMGQHPLRKKILRLVSWKCQISDPFLV